MYFRLYFWLLLFVPIAGVSAVEYRPYTHIQSVSYSQPIAIQSMLNEWQPPFKGGSKAFTFNKAEVGVRWRDWQFGVLERYDYLLEFSPQTAELFNLVENRLPLETGREYELRITARQQYSRGLRLGYRQKIRPNFSVVLAASYLQGRSLTDGGILGAAQVTANNDYEFQFETDYFYSRDVLFERDVAAPKGSGYSTDITFDWQPSKRFKAQLSIVDLLGKIFWKNAPRTVATASAARKTFDENGYVRYEPAISGRESNQNFTQILPRKIFFSAKYQWSRNVELLTEIQDFEIVRFISAGAGWCYRRSDCFQGLFNRTAGALSLRYLGHGLRVELASDRLNINRARYLVFQFSFNQNF